MVRAQIDAGAVGEVEMIQITSRDHAPPPIEFVKRSGGMFRDMMIHDLDMARFLMGEEFVEVLLVACAHPRITRGMDPRCPAKGIDDDAGGIPRVRSAADRAGGGR